MFEYRKLPADVIKYLIIGAIIFGLVIIIPYNKLGVKDSIILAIILTLTVAIIENATKIITSDTATEKFDGEVIAPINVPEVPSAQVPTQQTIEPPVQLPVGKQSVQTDVSTESTASTQNTVGITATIESSPSVEQRLEQQRQQLQQQQLQQKSKLYVNVPHGEDKEANGSREDDDVALNDLPYTDYHHIPLGDTYKPSEFEYGYSFLPPEKWYPTPPFPPVCVSEKRCPVCPVFTTGTPVDVKEWNSSRKITQPAGINTKYIKDTLNAGR